MKRNKVYAVAMLYADERGEVKLEAGSITASSNATIAQVKETALQFLKEKYPKGSHHKVCIDIVPPESYLDSNFLDQ